MRDSVARLVNESDEYGWHFSNGSSCFPSFVSAGVFSGSTESNKKITLGVLCVYAVNYDLI